VLDPFMGSGTTGRVFVISWGEVLWGMI